MQKAIVSGASTGIGLAIIQKLTQEGIEVFGLARDFQKTHFKNKNFHQIQCDLRNVKQIQKLSSQIPEVDILINNAGVGYFDYLEKLSEFQILEMLETNLAGMIFLTQTFLPKLKKSEGQILNIASESALKGEKLGTVYCATKFGVRGFSEALFAELRKERVRVTCLNPGMVKSSFFDSKNFMPENRPGCYLLPEDIAETVWQIISLPKGSIIKELEISPQLKSIIKK